MLTSSLNVELVYIILKSISSFSNLNIEPADRDTNRDSGLVITNSQEKEPIREIDLDAPKIIFEKQIQAECKKSRHISLNQIEIKMVDEKEEKGLAQFMYEGIDNQRIERGNSL